MVKQPILLATLAGLGACSSLTPVDDPVYLRITDIEARLIRLERVLENESLISLASDIASLRTEVQDLLGQVEQLQYEQQNQAERQRDLYLDLDERLSQLENAQQRLATLPSGGSGGAAAQTDQQSYDSGFALIQSQRFADAQAAFEAFLRNYPASPLRANAQYWLAEAHYAQLSFQSALTEFQRVLEQYPDSNKVPDALLKIGYCNDELGNQDAARQALLRVTREFPDTSAAGYAEERLQRIAAGAR